MISKRRSLLLGLAALTFSLVGCASKPDLSRIQDPNVDFNAYRTFAVIQTRPDSHSSLIERRLISAARSQLERRGYVFDESAPDVLVNLAAVVEERQGLRAKPAGVLGVGGTETEDYRLGRLAIDVIDARRGDVVWHGAAEGRLTPEMLRDAGSAAEKAVAAVFDGFPIKPRARAAAVNASTSR